MRREAPPAQTITSGATPSSNDLDEQSNAPINPESEYTDCALGHEVAKILEDSLSQNYDERIRLIHRLWKDKRYAPLAKAIARFYYAKKADRDLLIHHAQNIENFEN